MRLDIGGLGLTEATDNVHNSAIDNVHNGTNGEAQSQPVTVVRIYRLPKCPSCDKLQAKWPNAEVHQLRCLNGNCSPLETADRERLIDDRSACAFYDVLLDRAVCIWSDGRATNG